MGCDIPHCRLHVFTIQYSMVIKLSLWNVQVVVFCFYLFFIIFGIFRQNLTKQSMRTLFFFNGRKYTSTSVQKRTESSAATHDEKLRLYIPCRTECVWSCLSHRLGSWGVYGRWLDIYQHPQQEKWGRTRITVCHASVQPKDPILLQLPLSCSPAQYLVTPQSFSKVTRKWSVLFPFSTICNVAPVVVGSLQHRGLFI